MTPPGPDHLARLTDLGHTYPATRKPLPEYDGRHVWVVVAMFRITNPARSEYLLDRESLATVDGPGCFHCEQTWSPTLGAKCPGDPNPYMGEPVPAPGSMQ
jgi:hypothetical protein